MFSRKCSDDKEDDRALQRILRYFSQVNRRDYSWGEIDFVTKPMNEMRLMECTECEMSAPAAYDIDIEADDIDVTDTVTVVWKNILDLKNLWHCVW